LNYRDDMHGQFDYEGVLDSFVIGALPDSLDQFQGLTEATIAGLIAISDRFSVFGIAILGQQMLYLPQMSLFFMIKSVLESDREDGVV